MTGLLCFSAQFSAGVYRGAVAFFMNSRQVNFLSCIRATFSP
jgi:hypothetical protein